MFEDWFDGLSNMKAFWFIFVIVVAAFGLIATLAIISPLALAVLGVILMIACMAGVIAFGILMMIREDIE